MKTFFAFILYFIACLLITAAVYFPVYEFIHLFLEARPDRVFYRTAMIIAMLGFWPFLKHLGINDAKIIGFALNKTRFFHELTRGILIGLSIMLLIITLLILLDVRTLDFEEPSALDLLTVVLAAFVSAILIGFIEEIFFRGTLQGGMQRTSSFWLSAVVVALFYATLHFTRPPAPPDDYSIGWLSGFHLLSGMTYKYADFGAIADSFLALLMAGVFLSLLRQYRNNIAICIGVHAGWVIAIKTAKSFTDTNRQSPELWLVGSYDHVIGWLAFTVISLISLLYWRLNKIRG